MPSILRIGQGNTFVDNGGAGGILAPIDLETGIIHSIPMDKLLNKYIIHPDTGVQIIGYKIPRWNEAIALARKLAYVVPSVRYVGWDLALTDDGWIMIEGNDNGQFVARQMLDQSGEKQMYYSLI